MKDYQSERLSRKKHEKIHRRKWAGTMLLLCQKWEICNQNQNYYM